MERKVVLLLEKGTKIENGREKTPQQILKSQISSEQPFIIETGWKTWRKVYQSGRLCLDIAAKEGEHITKVSSDGRIKKSL